MQVHQHRTRIEHQRGFDQAGGYYNLLKKGSHITTITGLDDGNIKTLGRLLVVVGSAMAENETGRSAMGNIVRLGGVGIVILVMAVAFDGMGNDINKFSNPGRMMPFLP